MAWDTDLVLMVRVLVNDLAEPYKHSDEYLRRVVVCAGILVRKDIELPFDYVLDMANSTITPDPVDSADSVTMALLPLKAACIINQAQYLSAVGQAIKVRDGDSQIDTSVSFKGYQDIIKLGPCATYAKLKWELQACSAAAVGAIAGPYRPAGYGAPNSIASMYDTLADSLLSARRRMV